MLPLLFHRAGDCLLPPSNGFSLSKLRRTRRAHRRLAGLARSLPGRIRAASVPPVWGTERDVRLRCSGHKGPAPGLRDRRWARRARLARPSTRVGRALWLGKPDPWFHCAETTIERTSSPRIKEEKMSPDRMVGFARGQLGTADGDRGPRRRSRHARVCASISTASRGYFRLLSRDSDDVRAKGTATLSLSLLWKRG